MRVWAITMGYVPARIWKESAHSFYSTLSGEVEITHVFVDQHYPLNLEQNRDECYAICARHNIWITNPKKNLGLHDGFNWAISQLPIKDEDIIIGYDPDSKPLTPGWDKALCTALSDWRLVWASLSNPRSDVELEERGYIEHRVRDVWLKIVLQGVTNSVCAFNAGFLREIGGLSELLAYYGHLEASMFPKLKAVNKEWVFLRDYRESDEYRSLHDPEYTRWKWYYAHLKIWYTNFESYVAAGCPELRPVPDKLP